VVTRDYSFYDYKGARMCFVETSSLGLSILHIHELLISLYSMVFDIPHHHSWNPRLFLSRSRHPRPRFNTCTALSVKLYETKGTFDSSISSSNYTTVFLTFSVHQNRHIKIDIKEYQTSDCIQKKKSRG
jgi:hypothetical protein